MKDMKGKHYGLADNEVAMNDVGLCKAVYAVDRAKPGSDVVGACLHANNSDDARVQVAPAHYPFESHDPMAALILHVLQASHGNKLQTQDSRQ